MAGEVIERIRKNVGVSWRTETVDRIIAGSPDAPVKGIAATMIATLDVLRRAAASGKNLVITHEPTFDSHQDATEALTGDATYQLKAGFIRREGLVVFRFHDHWHAPRPDGIATGMARELGWEKSAAAGDPRWFVFPETPLVRLAAQIRSRRKALILLGHVVSEQAGMKYCAEWLKSFITEAPIEFVAAVEPFWSPEHPPA